jgi:hypothetical protein
MFYCNTYKNRETAKWFFCHYDLFSQILRLKKSMSKQTFFCFTAATGILHEHLRTLYCFRPDKFAAKVSLWNTQYLYIDESDMQLKNTYREYIVVFTATMVTRKRQNLTLRAKFLSCSSSVSQAKPTPDSSNSSTLRLDPVKSFYGLITFCQALAVQIITSPSQCTEDSTRNLWAPCTGKYMH